jgi:hypothetical protein
LFPPQLDGVPAVGVSGNLVVDAAGAARNLGELLTSPSYGGIDPSFSVPAILAQYPVDGTVTGDVVPDPGQISVDGPSGSVRERPVGVDNPWTVVLAVVDGGGGCSAVVVSGFPRLDQFLEVPGACSARAALG